MRPTHQAFEQDQTHCALIGIEQAAMTNTQLHLILALLVSTPGLSFMVPKGMISP